MAASLRTPCLFFCLLVSLALSASPTARSQTFNGSWCPAPASTMSNTYRANLYSLLSTISSDIRGNTSFYNDSYGQGTDQVNAIALCRGDLGGGDECRTCITNATEKVTTQLVCPNQITGTVWINGKCMLRYSNESIFGKLEIRSVQAIPNTTESASNSNSNQSFSQVVLPLLNGLKDEAAAGSSLLKFATGSAKLSSDNSSSEESVYALTQCTPDLSEADCKDCLSTVTIRFQDTCQGYKGCIAHTPSCNVRYDNYRFYNSNLTDDVQPPVASAPPPAANTATGKGQIIQGRLQILATLLVAPILFCFRFY